MGNSASGAASGAVNEAIKKEKKRCCRWCGFACGCSILSVCCLAGGIALLVSFVAVLNDNYSGTTKARDEGLTYFGIALLILGAILLIVGVLFCVALYISYKRLNGRPDDKMRFETRTYPPGAAPYPQQDWGNVPNPTQPAVPQVATNSSMYEDRDEIQLIKPELQ